MTALPYIVPYYATTMMNKAANILPGEMESFAGDLCSLLHRIGSSEEIFRHDDLSEVGPIKDFPALKTFLQSYTAKILVPVELAAICDGYGHATRYECKELVALDRRLANEARLKPFAAASQHVGQHHLLRMRPLKENRFIQRYIAAVQAGDASAWHTLVYAISLAIYSVPLRQGLLAYSQLTLGSFVDSAASTLRLSETECDRLLHEVSGSLPRSIDGLLTNGQFALFKAA